MDDGGKCAILLVMEASMKLRKQKVLARMRLRRRLAKGQVRLEQVSLAAAAHPDSFKSPLGTRRIKLDEYEDLGY